MAGGNNGGACVNSHYSNCFVQNGNAACSYSIPRYALVELTGDLRRLAEEKGFSWYMICKDRGGPSVGIDMALVSDNVTEDLYKANDWGHKRGIVRVWLNPLDFYRELARRNELESINR